MNSNIYHCALYQDRTMSDQELRDQTEDEELPSRNQTTIIQSNMLDSSIGTIYSRFVAHHTPFGFQSREETVEFHPMPYRPEPDDTLLLAQPWRVMLEMFEDEKRRVLGLDLYGDVLLGRGSSRPGHILVNLEPYNAQGHGVSREHALLRPTKAHLYVIDQGSTNGTVVNGATKGKGVAISLKNEDLLRLGNLVLMLYIVAKPGDPIAPTP
jgi:hypothetical protein